MVYLHIPFCKSFCTYCDFYSELCREKDSAQVQKLFSSGVCEEIHLRRPEISSCSDLSTLYVGGGTPSVLSVDLLETIVSRLGGGPYTEFTVEVNPEDVVELGGDYVRRLIAMGVNRISMGVQSMDDGLLRWMNRRHDSSGAVRAFEVLRESGVENISLDLIFGITHLSDEMWTETVAKVLSMGPEHISAYQLSVEEGSALGQMMRDGRYVEADEEQCHRQYDILCDMLGASGYNHYEISNFALPGHEAVHNSAYWERKPYVGLGPGAHSFDGSRRSWNSQSVVGWSSEYEILSESDIRDERVMLGLRTAKGLPEEELVALCSTDAVSRHLADGSLIRFSADGSSRIRIPESHFFISDSIISDL